MLLQASSSADVSGDFGQSGPLQHEFVPRLKDWQQSLDAALECLVGNHRDEMLFTDPHIRHKLKESEAWS